jgi:hypothetical protein
MKLRVAALAAALVVIGSGPGTASAQDDADGVRRLLARVEQVVLSGEPAEYDALLADSADRAKAAQFAREELRPGATRVVIHERDRLELTWTSGRTGYRIGVDIFEEHGDRARVSTWRLDLARKEGATGGDLELGIADQARVSSVDNLYKLSLDATKRFVATNLSLMDEDLSLTLTEGSVFVASIDRGTTALVLIGRGRMRFDPAPEAEKIQARIFSGADVLDTPFDAAYLRINPADFDWLVRDGQLQPAPLDADGFRRASRIFSEDSPKTYTLELGDLSPDPWSPVPPPGDLVAEIHTRRFGTLTYSRSGESREDIGLFDAAEKKTIARYQSKSNAAREASGAAFTDGAEFAPFTIPHYDIDVIATPERRWIEGRTSMTVHVGALAINTITLRLAEPLIVHSVVSEEYGRLFHMRVKHQGIVIISLPVTLLDAAQVTLTVTYAGRLEPQLVVGEAAAVAPAQGGVSPGFDPGIDEPEPSFLYSNQVNWYPRAPSSHYSTATLRITVPADQACLASGQADAQSPEMLPATGSTPARKAYVFHAQQPLRYFAFVVARMSAVPRPGEDSDLVSVHAHAGHDSRGREVARRAADIAGFYQSILHDMPYSSLTVALLENGRPGGHSPGYFAVLNEPSLYRMFSPRRDPASFDGFPDYVLAHEVAHQWWGQAVGWRDYHEQWLSEGFAQYFAALYAQHDSGERVFGQVMRHMQQWAARSTSAGPISLGSRLGHIEGDSRIFRALVYSKGAMVLHMLRRLVGDEVFFSGLRRFYGASRFRSVGTADFRAAMEAEAGRSLHRFFDGWIYGSAVPRLAFSYRVDGDDAVLRIDQPGPVFEFPVTVTLRYADKTTADVIVPVSGATAEVRVRLRGTLRSATLSREEPLLAEVVRN